jgi:hypothetical protein
MLYNITMLTILYESHGEPVGVGVDGELEGEVDGEEEVERVHDLPRPCILYILKIKKYIYIY